MKNLLSFNKSDKIISEFLAKNKKAIFIAMVTLLSLIIRLFFKNYESGDFIVFLKPWVEYLDFNGGFSAIKSIDSNYSVSYLYYLAFSTYLPFSSLFKIKLLSIFFDYICAGTVAFLVKSIRNGKKDDIVPVVAYAITLLLPTVIMNGALWAQCDIIYTTFILLSITYIYKEKFSIAFIFYGIALALKLQSIFLFPVYIYLYFKTKKFNCSNFLIIILVNVFLYLPALFLGKPFSQILQAYFEQTHENLSTVFSFPNLYVFLPNNYELLGKVGIVLTASIILLILFIIIYSKGYRPTIERIVDISLLFIMVVTYFLPVMHERYTFTADILGVIYLFNHKERFYIPLTIWFINSNSYLPFLFNMSPKVSFEIMAIMSLSVIALIAAGIYKDRDKETLLL